MLRHNLKVIERKSCSVVSDSLQLHGLQPTRLLCPLNSPGRILEWEAIPFSRGSFQPRGRTQVSCIAGSFFKDGATMEALVFLILQMRKQWPRDGKYSYIQY